MEVVDVLDSGVGLEVHGVLHGLDSVQTGDQVAATEIVQVTVPVYENKTPRSDSTSTAEQDR